MAELQRLKVTSRTRPRGAMAGNEALVLVHASRTAGREE